MEVIHLVTAIIVADGDVPSDDAQLRDLLLDKKVLDRAAFAHLTTGTSNA